MISISRNIGWIPDRLRETSGQCSELVITDNTGANMDIYKLVIYKLVMYKLSSIYWTMAKRPF